MTRDTDYRELAKELEERAGDLSQWNEKPRRIRVRRGGPSHTFSIRFAPEEMNLLQQAADERGITISELIRNAALASVQEGQASTVEEVQRKARELVRVASRLQA